MFKNAKIDRDMIAECCLDNGISPSVQNIEDILNRAAYDAFTYSHHRGVMAPIPACDKEQCVAKEDVATANLILAAYGVTMSQELMESCFKASTQSFHIFFAVLKELVGFETKAMDRGKTVWADYPYSVMSAPATILYIANLFHFLSGGKWQPDYNIKTVAPALDMEHMQALKVIPLSGNGMEGAAALVKELFSNAVPFTPDDTDSVKDLMSSQEFKAMIADKCTDLEIPVKENLALYASCMLDFYGEDFLNQKFADGFKTAKDVLRFAVACSNGDISLYANTKFRNFTRKERKLFLSMIENTSSIEENMASNVEQWKRLGERLHPGEFAKMYPKTAMAFSKIRSGEHIETYNTVLERLLKAPINVDNLSKHLLLRPGLFARYLDVCIRNCRDESEVGKIAFRFISVAKSVSPRVLLQLVNHFRNRNNPLNISVARQKGVKTRNVEREVPVIDQAYCNRLAQDIANELWQVLRKQNDESLSVYMDPALHCDKIIFPDNVRQLSMGARVVACGSRFSMPKENTIRAFLYWKGNDSGRFSGIDLDLSIGFLDASMENMLATVSYYNPKDDSVCGFHSGDRRSSGSDGAVEYIDFDVSAAKAAGARYAVMFVNSFSGQLFSSLDNVFCGVMARNGTGEVFDPRTVTDRFALTSNSRDSIPVFIDLVVGDIVVVDRAVGAGAHTNISCNATMIRSICKYVAALKSLSIAEMVQFRYPAITNTWQNADVIISDDPDKYLSEKKEETKILNPFDTQGLVSFVFGFGD